MHIVVKSEEVNINLPIPNFIFTNKLVFNTFVAQHKDIINVSIEKQDLLYRILKKGIKMHKGLVLVEVESADGEYVKITL